MKPTTVVSLLATAAVAEAQWWAGSPDCAHSCLSSYWNTASSWPSPGSYCTATQGASVSSCLSSACTATPTAYSSYVSLSSSLCSQWSSCSSSGSTGVYTVSLPGFTMNGGSKWAGGGGGGGSGYGPPGGWGSWSGTATWTGGVYTVTGCQWDGSPWAGGPYGWGTGGQGYGNGPWGQWGNAWSWTTQTATVTRTITSGGSTITTTGPATVAIAASGDVKSTTILGAVNAAVSATSGNAAPPSNGGDITVKVVGAALGGVIAVVAIL